jgi:hypothetical protein
MQSFFTGSIFSNMLSDFQFVLDVAPTGSPSGAPTTSPVQPGSPTAGPATAVPTSQPTLAPTGLSTTLSPTLGTTDTVPSEGPSTAPSLSPSLPGTEENTASPSSSLTIPGTSPQPSGTPTSGLTTVPTTADRQKVARVAEYYIAYVAPGGTEPTEDQYNSMLNITTTYFEEVFTEFFSTDPTVQFEGINSALRFTAFEDPNLPTEGDRFNIYMDYDFSDFLFGANSTIPDVDTLFGVMRDSINPTYILDWVRSLADSPFVLVNEVYFAASETASGPPAPTP